MTSHRATACTLFIAAITAAGMAGSLPPVPVPAGNPITPQKTLLGKALFWDEQLSASRTVACGSCHFPEAGGSDPRSLLDSARHPGADQTFFTADDVHGSPGVILAQQNGQYLKAAPFELALQVTGRKAPTTINAAFAPALFWDGRASSTFSDPISGSVVLIDNAALESQAVQPPVSSVEMAHQDMTWPEIVARVTSVRPLALASDLPADVATFIGTSSYPELFLLAFGSSEVTAARIAMAIATYERTLTSDQAPIDAFFAGDPFALTSQEIAGLGVFGSQGRCVQCHGFPQFTNQTFVNIGVRPPDEDPGLAGVTGLPEDRGKFRVASLRNVALRAPYFHNGSKASLVEVVEFYNRGGDFADNRSNLIQPLGLTDEQKASLVALLGRPMTDPRVAQNLPPFDRPRLYRESTHVPATYGDGAAGSGGHVPRFIAIEPPVLGNDGLTLAIDGGLGSAVAIIGLDVAPSDPGTIVLGIPFHLKGTPFLRLRVTGPLAPGAPGDGYRSLRMRVPDDPALDGVAIYLQWFVLDAGVATGIAATSGLELVLFR
ncbi:MAG: cytochrome c peroxidase [Planctomycetota bacterium]